MSARMTPDQSMNQRSITGWIGQFSDLEPEATEQLWQHFSARLHNLARRKLDAQTRRCYDEHDAANSAFHSLCRGINDGRFEVTDRDSLWSLLAVITSRKVAVQQRHEKRQKRGGGNVRGDSVFLDADLIGFDSVPANEPTPEFTAIVSESCERLLGTLKEPLLRQIVLLKFEGWRNKEVAEKLDRSRRTIERKLEVIRRIWVDAGVVLPETNEIDNQPEKRKKTAATMSQPEAE